MVDEQRKLPTHIVAVGGIVLNNHDEILLVKNARHGWTFPGGQVEEGENLPDALKREVMEETGVEIDIEQLFCVSSNTCKYPGYNGVKEIPTKVMFDFICRYRAGTPRPSDENDETRFFSREEAECLLTSQAYIQRFKAFKRFTDHPTYLEYITKPEFQLKLCMDI